MWWRISADTLARSRFVVSPLAEVIAALKTLQQGSAHAADRPWVDAHLPAYRDHMAARPVTASLVAAALRPNWNADFLTPTPDGDGVVEAELACVRATPPDTVRHDLLVSLHGRLPAELDRPDLAARTADLLSWVWTATVEPTWPRRRRVIEADIGARTARLTRSGWAAALEGMRPGMRWLGGSRLRIHTRDLPPQELTDAQLMFVPVTPRQSWVSWEANRYAVTYPCTGVLAPDSPGAPESLARLLGPARARVLVLLDTPKSTSQLVELTGHGLGSVGGHLKVLLDGALVHRRRAGRSVLYHRTRVGESLVLAQSPAASVTPVGACVPD